MALSVAVLQPRFDRKKTEPLPMRPVEADFEEAQALTQAINLDIKHAEIISVREKISATLLGSGTVERLGDIFAEQKIKLVFINTALSPIQQRNLEKIWRLKVIDRQGLILEIFGARAKTSEGKLQVELAALLYQKSKIVRSWTHLERQRGGLGKTGGPGEMQKELDRRMVADKIRQVRRELEKVVQNRAVQRAARERVPFPIVALVGYTNAGKSTLFNALTNEQVVAKDLLFATLDTTLRAMRLPSGRMVILSDTVGFISQLPPELVAAFRATLEETVHADVILHVRDIAAPYTEAEQQDVITTLQRMKLGHEVVLREVWNKADLLTESQHETMQNLAQNPNAPGMVISAMNGNGLPQLLETLDNLLADSDLVKTVTIPATEGETLAWLYRHARILQRDDKDTDIIASIQISPAKINKFKTLYPNVAI